MDGFHDVKETSVHFLARPGNAHAILSHLQTGGGHATGIRCLSWAKEDTRFQELVHAVNGRRHVRALGHGKDAIL